MRRTIILILLGFLLTSCGASYQLSTINHDPIYIDDVRVDVIENEMQLDWKLRTDSKFRWDFSRYASTQSLRWHYDFYYDNRMWRSPFRSPFDFYWNSNDFWWHWGSNNYFMYSHWNRFGLYGYNRWSPFGYDRWGYNNSWGWNGYGFNNWAWRNRMNDIAYHNKKRTNTAYINGRRGSNVVVTPNGGSNRGNDVVIRNRGRNNNVNISEDVRRYKDKIISRKNIDDIAKDLNNGRKVRTYENPNRIRNNNNNNINRSNINNRPSRNYNVPRPNNNNIRSNNNNIRRTPPPTRVSPPVRSNISRGSSNVGRSSSSVIRRNE